MSGLSKSTATGFRDGNVNLHHVHVGKRRTCRFCHRTHAGPKDRLVPETVGYGRAGYELKIGFEKTEDGRACARTCHDPAAYARSMRPEEGEP